MAAGTLPPPQGRALSPRTLGLPRCSLAPAGPSHCWLPLQRELPQTVCATQRPQDLGRRPQGGPGEGRIRSQGLSTWKAELLSCTTRTQALKALKLLVWGLPELPGNSDLPWATSPPSLPPQSSPHQTRLSQPARKGTAFQHPPFPILGMDWRFCPGSVCLSLWAHFTILQSWVQRLDKGKQRCLP